MMTHLLERFSIGFFNGVVMCALCLRRSAHEAPRFHHTARQRGGVAARGARAAADDAGDRVTPRHSAWHVYSRTTRISPRSQRDGYVERENVRIEYRWADNQLGRLPELAAELARRQVTVIVVAGHDATLAAKTATTTIPVVFLAADDPVRLGLVSSLARPGGNLTGFNILTSEMAAKQLELLHELMPGATRVAALLNPANATTTQVMLRDLEPAARALGLQIQVINADTSDEINAAFATSK